MSRDKNNALLIQSTFQTSLVASARSSHVRLSGLNSSIAHLRKPAKHPGLSRLPITQKAPELLTESASSSAEHADLTTSCIQQTESTKHYCPSLTLSLHPQSTPTWRKGQRIVNILYIYFKTNFNKHLCPCFHLRRLLCFKSALGGFARRTIEFFFSGAFSIFPPAERCLERIKGPVRICHHSSILKRRLYLLTFVIHDDFSNLLFSQSFALSSSSTLVLLHKVKHANRIKWANKIPSWQIKHSIQHTAHLLAARCGVYWFHSDRQWYLLVGWAAVGKVGLNEAT